MQWCPDGIAQIELPVILFDINLTIEWWPDLAIFIGNIWMVDVISEFLTFGFLDLRDETKLNVYLGGDVNSGLGNTDCIKYVINSEPLRVFNSRHIDEKMATPF